MLTIGYALGSDYCGIGYARHAVHLLISFLFNEININRIQAFVMPENKKSAEVLLHNGFQKEGTLRKGVNWNAQGIIDIDLYAKLLEGFLRKTRSATAEEIDLTYIMQKTEHTVREKYFEILNIDIMKQLIEQLKSTHPALIEGVVPEQFSYALLTRISRQMLQRGNGMRYLPKIIEALQFCFMEQNSREISLLCEYVAGYIEREDNFYVYMEKRKNY